MQEDGKAVNINARSYMYQQVRMHLNVHGTFCVGKEPEYIYRFEVKVIDNITGDD